MGILSRVLGKNSVDDKIKKCTKQASEMNSKANVLVEMEKFDDALIMYDDSADMWERIADSFSKRNIDDKAQESHDRSVRTRSAKGPVYFRLGKYEDALKCVDSLTESYPDVALNWSNRGMALFSLERYEEALESFDRALELAPEFNVALCSKGSCLARLERYEESLEFFDKARDSAEIMHFDFPSFAFISPTGSSGLKADVSQACYFKGVVLSKIGRYEEAVESFDEALGVRPDFVEAADARKEALLHI